MSAKESKVEFVDVWKNWRSWKRFLTSKEDSLSTFFAEEQFAPLRVYASNGDFPPVPGIKHIKVNPPWNRCDAPFTHRSQYWLARACVAATEVERIQCFRLTCVATRHRSLVKNFILRQNCLNEPERYERDRRFLSMLAVFDYALAVVHDSGRHVKQMIEMHIANYDNNEFYDAIHYPLAHATLRILCDAFGVTTTNFYPVDGSISALNELVEHWRTENIGQYQRMMHKLCDIHTWQCRQSKMSGNDPVWREFDNGEFDNYPVEVLMIMRLRQNLGLPNPEIDHPLMQRPLSYLPEVSTEEVHDELLDAVLARMKTQGYDEEQIYLWTVKPETCTLEALQAVEAKAEAATPQP